MDLGQLGGAIVAAGAAVGALIYLGSVAWRLSRSLHRLVDVFLGDEKAGHPGVPQRLDRIEKQLLPNSGSSLRDSVDRIEKRFDEHVTHHQSPPTGAGLNNRPAPVAAKP